MSLRSIDDSTQTENVQWRKQIHSERPSSCVLSVSHFVDFLSGRMNENTKREENLRYAEIGGKRGSREEVNGKRCFMHASIDD